MGIEALVGVFITVAAAACVRGGLPSPSDRPLPVPRVGENGDDVAREERCMRTSEQHGKEANRKTRHERTRGKFGTAAEGVHARARACVFVFVCVCVCVCVCMKARE